MPETSLGLPLVMNIHVDTSSPTPPFEQIRAQVQAMVASGALPEGTRLPPIRQLAGDLGLAINTVARAYQELEREGVVRSRGRHGTVVANVDELSSETRRQIVDHAAEAFALEANQQGAGLEDAVNALRRAFTRLSDSGASLTSWEYPS